MSLFPLAKLIIGRIYYFWRVLLVGNSLSWLGSILMPMAKRSLPNIVVRQKDTTYHMTENGYSRHAVMRVFLNIELLLSMSVEDS
jgi:hypothetical protein